VEISQRTIGDLMILDASGEIDLYSSPKLRNELITLIEQRANGRPLLVNLGAVRYIDSSGLATLIEGRQKAQQKNVRLALSSMSEHVRDVFRLARLDQIFEVYDSEQEAIRGLEGA